MDSFYNLFQRYLGQKDSHIDLEWYKINNLGPDKLIPYNKILLSPVDAKHADSSLAFSSELLSKLAVIKLNGGLGTSMGCVGPKSAIEIRDRMSILDLAVQQIEVYCVFYRFLAS